MLNLTLLLDLRMLTVVTALTVNPAIDNETRSLTTSLTLSAHPDNSGFLQNINTTIELTSNVNIIF